MKNTAGQRLVKLLDEGLPSGIVWTANERAILALISDHADRAEALKALQGLVNLFEVQWE